MRTNTHKGVSYCGPAYIIGPPHICLGPRASHVNLTEPRKLHPSDTHSKTHPGDPPQRNTPDPPLRPTPETQFGDPETHPKDIPQRHPGETPRRHALETQPRDTDDSDTQSTGGPCGNAMSQPPVSQKDPSVSFGILLLESYGYQSGNGMALLLQSCGEP